MDRLLRTMTTSKNKAAPARARVRRGNAEDADQLRNELVEASLALFAEGGLEAVSIRSVSARVGISAMTMYRYFADKAELLGGVAAHALMASMQSLHERLEGVVDARERHRLAMEAFLDYWEDHPDEYCLVYGFTEVGEGRARKSQLTAPPNYGEYIGLHSQLTENLAEAIGAPLDRAKLAQDLRIAMLLGYLHGTMVFRRYPWSEASVLREAFIEQAQQSVERCLLDGR